MIKINFYQFEHASVLQYIGYSPIDFHNEMKLIIISQYLPNKSLNEILNKNITSNFWNDAKYFQLFKTQLFWLNKMETKIQILLYILNQKIKKSKMKQMICLIQ